MEGPRGGSKPVDEGAEAKHLRIMKEIFPILTHYNSVTNKALYDILAELPENRLREEVGSFFKSIYGVINHIYVADLLWLQRFRGTLPENASLKSGELEREVDVRTLDLFGGFGALRERREALDALIAAFIEELEEKDFETIVDYTNSRGDRNRYILWQALMHLFNHQTHHRGQVAEILDQFGVTNDYSNINRTLRQP